ncbi:putative nucleoside diphosphate kinase 5 [Vitis vinifera]|uniref:Nucleoside diphosphate kinase n=1 Tax=Vitis vinifera TaxID=29760 RepID=A0A438K7P3_VITVI|nr:putative nucleoside diphosphate kinase 5 [Vitis vinifera]
MALQIAPCVSRFLVLLLLVSVSLIGRSSSSGSAEKEKTFAMIKPDGLSGNYTDEIKNAILESGFIILREMTVRLDEDTAGKFYAEHSSRSFFPALVKYMTSGPVLVMVLEKVNAVADWRALIGPTDAQKAKVTHPHSFFAGFLIVSALIFSIRAMCGQDLEKNCVHGSDSPQSAEREISFFFEEFSSGAVGSKHDEL